MLYCHVNLQLYLKRDSGTSVFPVNFVKFLKKPFLQNTSGRLLLDVCHPGSTSFGLSLKVPALDFFFHGSTLKVIMTQKFVFGLLKSQINTTRLISEIKRTRQKLNNKIMLA